jgi:hypothetical protein
MRDVIICLVILVLLQILTPFWWWIILVPLVCGVLLAKTGWQAFRTGMLSAGLLWLAWSLYLMFSGSDIIAQRIAIMIGVNSTWLLVLMTALIAALSAGFSGSSGYFLRAALISPQRNSFSGKQGIN